MDATVFRDRARQCVDCGHHFVWTAREQARFKLLEARTGRRFFAPSRCRFCRRTEREWRLSEAPHWDDEPAAEIRGAK